MNGPAVVYRAYAADGTLLYVGVTTQLSTRLRAHRTQAKWWAEHVRIEHDAPLPRDEALESEREQISRLAPTHNQRRPFCKSDDIKTYSLTVDRAVLDRVREIARANHTTIAQQLRVAIDSMISDREQAAA